MVLKSIFLICGTGDLSFAITIRIQIPLIPTRGGEMWEEQFLQQAFVRRGTVGKRSISMVKSWKLHLSGTTLGKSSIMYKLRELGENSEKLFHEGACLGGLRSLKMHLAVPEPGVGLQLCFRGVGLGDLLKKAHLEGWCCSQFRDAQLQGFRPGKEFPFWLQETSTGREGQKMLLRKGKVLLCVREG